MSTHNIGFYEELTKIIFELLSNTHLISSAGGLRFCIHKTNDLLSRQQMTRSLI